MNRSSRIFGIIAIAILVLFVFWRIKTSPKRTAPSRIQQTISSAVSEPAEFAKQHFTGGVGVALMIDPTNGLATVNSIIPGSPAASAGLLRGDIITKVGDWPTAGQPLATVVEAIRGFAGGTVAVTVKRSDTNSSATQDLTFVIHRSSWNALGITNSAPASPGIPMTNTVPILVPAPRTTN